MTKEIKAWAKMWVTITAIIGVVVMECFAISHGVNGKLLVIAASIVAGLGGWVLKQPSWVQKLE